MVTMLNIGSRPTVAIQGGLGNQLFQWYFAHTLSNNCKFQADLLFDGAAGEMRNFELAEIFEHCIHVSKSKGRIARPKYLKVSHLMDKIWEVPNLRSITESFGYLREDPRTDQSQTDRKLRFVSYAKGYFQNYSYVDQAFTHVENEIFPFLNLMLSKVKTKFGINSPYSVIHIRRGDYLTGNFTPVKLGALDDHYFIKAARNHNFKNIILLTENPQEIATLKSNLRPNLVLGKEETDAWETLALMFGANQFLGSNSSLSWWGARLAASQGGMSLLPNEWSFWGNVRPTDFLFPDCVPTPVTWMQSSETSLK